MPMTVREAEKILKSLGFVEIKGGGKGSHRKFAKAGVRPITLTSHNKEVSLAVEKTVRKAQELLGK
ncbi:HicA toxin of toxin-antitoxin [Pilibacter termitis]|jgi:predicted RNA binding protein YcfA (HicA-like mRNA interferase family)|uniref:HicA toxin of toxin-antitoxin n=1 Tax=Pilibacter termitis TaxID=263852 RepID=A0A1T4KVZ5_9ENTE|nr:type II toxin-antitoxin system HicA family toxin [Pilibacter termitis]SJZ46599.1 HicA toxin of toxin-antitoxin [Pilibacter termitis]